MLKVMNEHTETPVLVGERLAAARRNANLNQTELGRLCGTPQSHISAMERGKRAPSIEMARTLAQVLGVIHLQLRSLEARAKDEASLGIADELSGIAETADEAYRDVREAILGLRETVREDDGLEGSLREYLRKYSRQTGIAATLNCEGDTRRALSPRSEVQLLRVVQEALTNTRKHSGAKRVAVRIDCLRPGVTLTIEDDGAGFDPSTIAGSMEGGFGMKSMRERVEQIGGSIDVHTAPNEGTTIVVRLDAEDTRGTPSAEAPGAARR